MDPYYPFNSKEEVLLYILINSPTPIVSQDAFLDTATLVAIIVYQQAEKFLQYFFHVLKEVNPFTPSLFQVQSIDLPMYISPSKVYLTSHYSFSRHTTTHIQCHLIALHRRRCPILCQLTFLDT